MQPVVNPPRGRVVLVTFRTNAFSRLRHQNRAAGLCPCTTGRFVAGGLHRECDFVKEPD